MQSPSSFFFLSKLVWFFVSSYSSFQKKNHQNLKEQISSKPTKPSIPLFKSKYHLQTSFTGPLGHTQSNIRQQASDYQYIGLCPTVSALQQFSNDKNIVILSIFPFTSDPILAPWSDPYLLPSTTPRWLPSAYPSWYPSPWNLWRQKYNF